MSVLYSIIKQSGQYHRLWLKCQGVARVKTISKGLQLKELQPLWNLVICVSYGGRQVLVNYSMRKMVPTPTPQALPVNWPST